jgi:hypothetical protein
MTTTTRKPKRVSAHDSAPLVIKREEFIASSMRGEQYTIGGAPHLSDRDTWMNEWETRAYALRRASVTYIVWSFYTPIAYYHEATDPAPAGWYKVGQTFSPFTSRHQSRGLRLVPGHPVTMTGEKGDWTATCSHCGGERHFTRRQDADRVYYNHR